MIKSVWKKEQIIVNEIEIRGHIAVKNNEGNHGKAIKGFV